MDSMTALEAIAYYGSSYRMTEALGLKPNATFSWKGGDIPPVQQMRLEAMTGGVLRADDAAWHPAPPRYTMAEHKAAYHAWKESKKAGA
jgi:hypothetical protein